MTSKMAAARRIFLATVFFIEVAQNTDAFAVPNLLYTAHRSSVRLTPRFPVCGKYRRSALARSLIRSSAISVDTKGNSKSLASQSNLITAPINAPHLVILPGFGNADVDYKNPFGAGLDRSILHVLASRGFQVHIMPLKVSLFVSDLFRFVGARGSVGTPSYLQREWTMFS